MNKIMYLLYFIVFLMVSFAGFPQEKNLLSEEELKDGWQLLFNGETLEGWKGFHSDKPPAGWSVDDGLLVASGKGGDLGGDIITTGKYEDFELYLEWAISEGGNSGIFFHVLEGEYPSTYATGPEYQLIDDEGFPGDLEEWQKTGANYAMHPPDPSVKEIMPPGSFNTSRIRVKEGIVVHWLNGKEIAGYELWTDDWFERVRSGKWNNFPGYGKARKGYIGLQDHGSPAFFRNIKIKDLTDKGVPLFNGTDLEGWVIHGDGNWYAENGILTGSNPEGGAYSYLVTEEEYYDFILRLDFRFEGYGNSGVFFRSIIDGVDITGWQAEVAPPGEDSGGIYESGGRGWLADIPGERENILKENDWNNMVIRVKGNQVITWLNDEMMVCLDDEKIGEGNGIIALQLHSGEKVNVRWKNIFIKEL